MVKFSKHSQKTGFTLIEVALVLAIGGMLFAGVIGGTATNITRQRYNDSVQSFAEFLRRQYSEVVNVQNVREDALAKDTPCTIYSSQVLGDLADNNTKAETGRTNCLIYGKLITFGEQAYDGKTTIYSYDVIGDVIDGGDIEEGTVRNLSILDALHVLNTDAVTVRDESSNCNFAYAGNATSYNIEWDASAETTSADHDPFKGSILIVRSPASGAVHTYYLSNTINIQDLLKTNPTSFECHSGSVSAAQSHANSRKNTINSSSRRLQILNTYLDNSDSTVAHFKQKDINICVNSDDIFALNGQRRMIRIAKDGANASAVELIAADDAGSNKCK